MHAGPWSLEIRLSQPRLGILSQPIPKILQVFFNFRFDSVEVCAGEFFAFWLASRKEVILYFGLCARWAHRDARAVFQLKHQHFRFWNQIAFDIFDLIRLKISNVRHS